MAGVGLISAHDEGPGYGVYDGTYVGGNCSSIASWIQWTYSPGMLLQAAAVMWNVTQDPKWEDRANGIWQASHVSVVPYCCQCRLAKKKFVLMHVVDLLHARENLMGSRLRATRR